MALNPILWIEVDLHLCLDFVPTISQENFIHFKKIQLYFSVLCILGNVLSQLLFSLMKKSFVRH